MSISMKVEQAVEDFELNSIITEIVESSLKEILKRSAEKAEEEADRDAETDIQQETSMMLQADREEVIRKEHKIMGKNFWKKRPQKGTLFDSGLERRSLWATPSRKPKFIWKFNENCKFVGKSRRKEGFESEDPKKIRISS
jgi:hypothetical protein